MGCRNCIQRIAPSDTGNRSTASGHTEKRAPASPLRRPFQCGSPSETVRFFLVATQFRRRLRRVQGTFAAPASSLRSLRLAPLTAPVRPLSGSRLSSGGAFGASREHSLLPASSLRTLRAPPLTAACGPSWVVAQLLVLQQEHPYGSALGDAVAVGDEGEGVGGRHAREHVAGLEAGSLGDV